MARLRNIMALIVAALLWSGTAHAQNVFGSIAEVFTCPPDSFACITLYSFPASDAQIVVKNAKGRRVAVVGANENGEFSLNLSKGSYKLELLPKSYPARGEYRITTPASFRVKARRKVTLAIEVKKAS